MVRKKEKTELDKAEIKLRSLLEQRDVWNEQARVLRQERDMLNDKRKSVVDEMHHVKDDRERFVQEMRSHRDKRNAMHQRARSLIEQKRSRRGQLKRGVGGDLGRLRKAIEDMDRRQQTTTMTLAEENELIDEIRKAVREVRTLEREKGEQEQVFKDVKDLDAAIDDLMGKADEEHAKVVALSGKAQEAHDRVTQLVRDISVLIAEANKKHEEFVAMREKADKYHEASLEMRDKVLAERKASRAEEFETRDALRAQKQKVRAQFQDKKKLDEAADRAFEALLKEGKLELRG
jgi:phosphoserine phosphatase